MSCWEATRCAPPCWLEPSEKTSKLSGSTTCSLPSKRCAAQFVSAAPSRRLPLPTPANSLTALPTPHWSLLPPLASRRFCRQHICAQQFCLRHTSGGRYCSAVTPSLPRRRRTCCSVVSSETSATQPAPSALCKHTAARAVSTARPQRRYHYL